jgi:hypothetical protein
MTFTLHGTIEGRPALVRWVDGRLEGDGFAVDLVRELVRSRQDVAVTATGPFYPAGTRDAQRAFLTIGSVFDPGAIVTGEPPEPYQPPEIPDGAIA